MNYIKQYECEHTQMKEEPEIIFKMHWRHEINTANAQLMRALFSYVTDPFHFHIYVSQRKGSATWSLKL